MSVRLVATDLDGTLLRNDLSVSPRTRAALDAVREAGVHVVPVTARQPVGVRHIAEDCGFDGWALCSNGGLGIHLGTGERLFESTLEAATQRALVEALDAEVPGLLYVSVRDAGEVFVAQEGYAALAAFEDHKREPATMGAHALADVLAEPSLKFIVRHPDLPLDQLLVRVQGLGLEGFEVTHSGAPFLEVLPEGVSKAWGLAKLCAELGVEQHEVLAFGDALNDVELLVWAGRGVAVANAVPDARAVADEITASNEEDGVAIVLERLVGG